MIISMSMLMVVVNKGEFIFKKCVLLTATFRVSTEFLVREFRHLSSSVCGWQRKPH